MIVPTPRRKQKLSYNRKMTNKKTAYIIILAYIFFSILISSCKSAVSPSPTEEANSVTEENLLSEPRKLTICLGYEPESLYLYKASTQVEWDILQAIYDGPFDEIDGEIIPVILQSLPSTQNGGIEMNQVTLNAGDTILNASGNPTQLVAGVEYLPSGCTSTDCAVTWNGTDPLVLDQAQITFQLKNGLQWSDGDPLTAEDSVFSFILAADPSTPTDKTTPNQIVRYTALDEHTIQVILRPGLIPDNAEAYFFPPLPSHAWEEYTASEILEADFANKTPLGWGAYSIKEWNDESIVLEKNPFYFRSSEGLPYFDELEFRFISNLGDTNLASLEFDYEPYEIPEYNWSPDGKPVYSDQCDLVDATVDFSDQYDVLEYLLNYYITPAVQVNLLPNTILEGLWLNPERSNVTHLQPILSMCIDRTYINSKTNYKLAFPTYSIFESQQPAADDGYSPETAAQMLDALGWVDNDADPETPRVAQGIASVEDGSPLILSMIVPNDPLYERESTAIQTSLKDCGIQLDIQTYNSWDYLAQDGPVFKLDFDLMPFSQTITDGFPCTYLDEEWSSTTLPSIEKVEQLTQLCSAIRSNPPGNLDEKSITEIEKAMPLIPLFYHADVSVARADMCGFNPTVGPTSDLWNLEEFNYGDACTK